MNITQLQYLVDVGELGSFTEAAKKNLMTVPAISLSITQLESELDVLLFTRSRKGVTPTVEGKKVIQHAVTVLKTIDRLKFDIAVSKNNQYGNIVIATIPGLVSQIINNTLEFRESYPYINVQVMEEDTAAVLEQVKKGHADMGFVSLGSNNHDDALDWEPVKRVEVVLAVNKSSILRFNNKISLDQIINEMNESIVLYNDPYLKKIAEDLFPENLRNRIALTTNNGEVLLQMVLQRNAITITNDYIIQALPPHLKEEVVTISINEYLTLSNYLWRVTRKNEKCPEMIDQFTEHLLQDLK